MKKMNTYKIAPTYEHIISGFNENEEYYAYSLYDLCETYSIRYEEQELDDLEAILDMGYQIILGDLAIRRV
jgi:hypothetical protein